MPSLGLMNSAISGILHLNLKRSHTSGLNPFLVHAAELVIHVQRIWPRIQQVARHLADVDDESGLGIMDVFPDIGGGKLLANDKIYPLEHAAGAGYRGYRPVP